MKNIIKATLLFALISGSIHAFEVKVKIFNDSRKAPASGVESVELSQMPHMNQAIETRKNPGSSVTFSNLEDSAEINYMIKVRYKKINYIKVFSYSGSPKETIEVHVFDTTSDFDKNVKLEKIIEVYHFEGAILVNTTLIFVNNSKYAFTEKNEPEEGFYQFLPDTPVIQKVMASAGEGEEVDWFPVRIQSAEGQENVYLLRNAIEPGKPLMLIQQLFRYDGHIEIPMQNIYPQANPQLTFHMEGMSASIKEYPNWDTSYKMNENIGIKTVNLPGDQKRFTLVLHGGEPEPLPPELKNALSGSGDQTPEVVSPLHLYAKIGLTVLFLFFSAGLYFYVKTDPIWLQKQRAKQKHALEFELDLLDKRPLSEEKKEARRKRIESKIRYLEQKLK